jgi:hypothetical protein
VACQSGAEVAQEQEKIMEELEKDYHEARAKGDKSEDDDWALENPNHKAGAWGNAEQEEEDDSQDPAPDEADGPTDHPVNLSN